MNNIKELIDKLGMQQKTVACYCHVSGPTVSDWVNGKKNPRGKNLVKLTELFNVSNGVVLGYDPVPANIGNSTNNGPDEVIVEVADAEDNAVYILTEAEKALIRDYRALSTDGQAYIRQTMAMALNSMGQNDTVSVLGAG